MHLRNWRS